MTDSKNRTLPPIEQVLPNLWSVPVPLPPPWQAYVLVYVFGTTRGLYLVDVGWNDVDGWNALNNGLISIGHTITDVRGIVVTHAHSDHIGLASRVREASGAWVALHPADAAAARMRLRNLAGVRDRVTDLLHRAGAPDDEVEQQAEAMFARDPKDWLVEADILLEDKSRPDIPEWDLTVLWTPGHTPGHLCLYEGQHRLMLTGDHVLPRITPNISVMLDMGENPLGSYLASLERLADFDVAEVLPAHEYRFEDLPSRLIYLRNHHEERLSELRSLLESTPTTAWDLATRLTWSRPWERITGNARRAALGETLSHLEELQARHLAHEQIGMPSVWTVVE